MISEKLLELRAEVEACCGKIIRITLDGKGYKAWRYELGIPMCDERMLYGIVIDQVSECPTCGQDMKMKD